jgi:hypothetical protein
VFDSNITACIPLDIVSLPSITIANTVFDSNITACIPLDIVSLPSITIANTAFDSNIISIDPAVVFNCLTQEKPTTESFYGYNFGNTGVSAYSGQKVIRQLSLNTTGAILTYIYLYDIAGVPTNLDTPKFMYVIQNSNNVVFNDFDHLFLLGIGIRASTTLNGVVSPILNSIIVNMTLSD